MYAQLKNTCLGALVLSTCLAAHAGAWGDGALDNDAAQDWLAQCAETADAALVPEAIDMALVASYVEADDGAVAVAAAEVIAHALERGGAAKRAPVAPCLASTAPAEIRALASRARQALVRVADPRVSELAQLWSEDGRNRSADTLRRLAQRLAR
ncbi:DUF4259 domain-containing protein [Variovorax sp. JS1663]|uniref:DUF4259 domain-containing protein n=1 Tax=Variovorax sp. JS1663 TaxID=1851577 RepID=UPI000B3453A2|nr:DUF4259 domain-containing protein [Variovorax sp. JS1663]OUM03501.1 hypothetical protein A8M77_05430 [Variovorax sp. JS1663]